MDRTRKGPPRRTAPAAFPRRERLLACLPLLTFLALRAVLQQHPHIGDFTRWKKHDAYQKALDRLLRDLRVEKG
jgi:hypothetical protein